MRKFKILKNVVQVAGKVALGGDALPFLEVALDDDDGLHSHIACGAEVQRAAEHLTAV